MSESPTTKSPAFAADDMFGWIEQQAALGPRRAGSPAGLQNERFLEAQLRAFGLEAVRKEPLPITCWEATTVRLEVDGGAGFAPFETFPIPFAAFTPADGLEAELVFADRERWFQRDDWRGKVVVTEIGFPPLDAGKMMLVGLGAFDPDHNIRQTNHPATFVRLGWHLYREAHRRGALGFVGILRDQPGGSARMYGPYGFREQDILDKPLPGVWVGRKEGVELRRMAEAGARARLHLCGTRAPGYTHNVVGEIPGETDETLVLSCHHDSPFSSPVEDASGVAVVLALARHFAERRELKRRLVVLLSAGHFYGSIGTRSFIRDHAEVVRRTAMEISIEHIAREAVEDAAGNLVPTGLPEPTGIFVPFNRTVADLTLGAMAEHGVDRVVMLPAEGPFGNYPPTDGGDWYEAGVPVINFISNPVYLLTDDDALKWVDRERLPRVAQAFADLVRKLDAVPFDEIRAEPLKARKLLMKLLRHVSWAKTTRFGRQPVY